MYSMRRMKLSAVRVGLAQRATGDYHRAAGIGVTHLSTNKAAIIYICMAVN